MNTILIVDDTQLNRKMMINILKKNIDDLIFLEAADGEQGLEAIYEKEINLVILDLNMPVKDGYEVLKEVRSDERFNNLPIIVNSSITDTQKIGEALSLGAIDFFTKSQKPEEMEVLISTKVYNVLKYYEYVNNIASMNKIVEHDMKIASAIQKDFLKTKKEFEGVDVYVHYEPFAMLSGDLFTTAEYKGKKWALLVDMRSNSISSTLLSLFFRELFMKYAKLCDTSNELMEKLNNEFINLVENNTGSVFFSATIALMKDDKIYITNAGATQPYIFSNEKITQVQTVGRMIGVMENSKYSEFENEFASGDALVMYTNGIFSKYEVTDTQKIKNTFEKIYEDFKKEDFNARKLTLNIYNSFLDKKNGIKEDLTIACLKK